MKSQNQLNDLFYLEEELVARGDYVKFSKKLSASPNKRASLKLFTNTLLCIWWLDSDFIELMITIFPDLQVKGMKYLWKIRSKYMIWRQKQILSATKELWYDSGHSMLTGSSADISIKVQLLQLFETCMNEISQQWNILNETETETSSSSSSSSVAFTESESGLEQAQITPNNTVQAETKTTTTTTTGQEEEEDDETTVIDLFIGGADPDDIRQSATLQDCWLLSALSILAGENGTIESLFVRHSINGHLMQGDRIEPTDASYHMIRFYHSDKDDWEHVIVDDLVPKAMTKSDPQGHSVYGHSREPETWVMMIEKAYAKWLRSDKGYDGLNLGLVTEALVALTGGASSELNIRSPSMQAEARSGKLWRRLIEFKKSGASLGCGSPSGEDSFWDCHGIVQGHAYAILDLRVSTILTLKIKKFVI